MAARFLPGVSSPFPVLLQRHLARTLGASALAAGLSLLPGCERNDLSCFELTSDLSCQEAGADMEGVVLCDGGSAWEVTGGVNSLAADTDCCLHAEMVTGSTMCQPYPPGIGVVDGRPLILEGEARTAPLLAGRGDGWVVESSVDVSRLSPEARRWLGERWSRAARMEHASIASFAKFALELSAHAAPPELLLAAHGAAADEVRHARECLSLATACSGKAAVPGAIEFPGGRIDLQLDLAAFVSEVVREGCIGETLAAIQAAEQLVHTKDAATARVLATIVEDESRHAELAWRTVRWAIAQGGAPVVEAARAVFADAASMAWTQGDDFDEDLTAWGFPPSHRVDRALQRAIEDVIQPAAALLLAA